MILWVSQLCVCVCTLCMWTVVDYVSYDQLFGVRNIFCHSSLARRMPHTAHVRWTHIHTFARAQQLVLMNNRKNIQYSDSVDDVVCRQYVYFISINLPPISVCVAFIALARRLSVQLCRFFLKFRTSVDMKNQSHFACGNFGNVSLPFRYAQYSNRYKPYGMWCHQSVAHVWRQKQTLVKRSVYIALHSHARVNTVFDSSMCLNT